LNELRGGIEGSVRPRGVGKEMNLPWKRIIWKKRKGRLRPAEVSSHQRKTQSVEWNRWKRGLFKVCAREEEGKLEKKRGSKKTTGKLRAKGGETGGRGRSDPSGHVRGWKNQASPGDLRIENLGINLIHFICKLSNGYSRICPQRTAS